MENPPAEIKDIILTLCTKPRAEQQAALLKYFTPDAEFVHPLCRVPPYKAGQPPTLALFGYKYKLPVGGSSARLDSRRALAGIFRWYKIMSPDIQVGFESVAWDEETGTLFVALHQRFALWFVPFYAANVRLVTQLSLRKVTTDEHRSYAEVAAAHAAALSDSGSNPGSAPLINGDGPTTRYYIARQEDHYQTNEVLKFFSMELGAFLWFFVQLFAALFSVGAAATVDTALAFFPSSKKSIKGR